MVFFPFLKVPSHEALSKGVSLLHVISPSKSALKFARYH